MYIPYNETHEYDSFLYLLACGGFAWLGMDVEAWSRRLASLDSTPPKLTPTYSMCRTNLTRSHL